MKKGVNCTQKNNWSVIGAEMPRHLDDVSKLLVLSRECQYRGTERI